jgi:hypothetical protein
VLACKCPDPQAYSIASAKNAIASDAVATVEEYKKIKYEYTMKWPASPFKESVWTVLGRSMEWGMIYSCRNWYSHTFGIEDVTAEEENKVFETAVKHYNMLLPLVQSLVNKFEATLQDEAACDSDVQELNARYLTLGEEVPWYSKDCEKVQLQIALQQEKFHAMFAATEAERSGHKGEVWVQVGLSGAEEWGSRDSESPQNVVSWFCSCEKDEGYEDDDTSRSCGNEVPDLNDLDGDPESASWQAFPKVAIGTVEIAKHSMEHTSLGKDDSNHEGKIMSASGTHIKWNAVRDIFGPINPMIAQRIARM